MKEREIIELLARQTAGGSDDLLVGIGDDCAVIRKDSRQVWLVTMDTLVEGVHFDRAWHPAALLGRKSVAVNISDVAAMGGRPVFAFLSLGLPPGFSEQWLVEFSGGLAEACREFGCLLAGGDTVRSPAGIVITLTLVGEMDTDQVALRRGARPGDTLWVSGSLGNAAAGLELCRQGRAEEARLRELVAAHLDPVPRLELGRRLVEAGLVQAMMDLSDGLATDLAHLCRQSGIGVTIDPARLPALPILLEAAQLQGRDPLAWMVAGGEDYELAFAASPADEQGILALGAETGVQVTPVGVFDERPGVRLIRPGQDGSGNVEVDISYNGYDHFS
ncbi:MAG: thiamine-phosphate kinase [Desulfobulbus sp.]|nr:MAG: thiamine-phosphate kinase [Desulfobulbus sp.]